MTRPRVVVTHRVHHPILELLSESTNVFANMSLESLPKHTLLERAKTAQALLAFIPDRIDEEFLSACPDLRIVAGAFKGCDNVDVDACTRRNVWVTMVPDLLAEPTAELAVTLLLGVARNLREGDRLVRRGNFRGWRPILYGRGLAGKTVGIVGMGAIGQAIARRLKPFQVRMLYADPQRLPGSTESEIGAEPSELGPLLGASDYVVLTAPFTPETDGMIDREALRRLKKGAMIVNVGRGSLVDEDAVVEALRSGHLDGYAADVFAFEDLPHSRRSGGIPQGFLEETSRTLLTPHLGSAVSETRLAIERCAAQSIIDALGGRIPSNAVNRIAASLAC
jgi:phosphonate dehydrogenase